MGRRRKPAKSFDLAAFSAKLEQMAVTDKPAPPPRESELLKVVREKYDLLKSAIVARGYTYRDVCTLLNSTGLERGVYPRALKEALIKVAGERDEVWDDGRTKLNQTDPEDDSELDEDDDPELDESDNLDNTEPELEEAISVDQQSLFDQMPRSNSSKSKKFVEVPQDL